MFPKKVFIVLLVIIFSEITIVVASSIDDIANSFMWKLAKLFW